MIPAFLACAGIDRDNRLALETTRRDAWHSSLGDDGTESIFGVYGSLAAFFLIGNIDQDLDEAAIGTFGDMVREGVNDDAALAAEEGLVIGGVIEITCKAGIIPQQDGCGAIRFIPCRGDHAIKVVTANRGSA